MLLGLKQERGELECREGYRWSGHSCLYSATVDKFATPEDMLVPEQIAKKITERSASFRVYGRPLRETEVWNMWIYRAHQT